MGNNNERRQACVWFHASKERPRLIVSQSMKPLGLPRVSLIGIQKTHGLTNPLQKNTIFPVASRATDTVAYLLLSYLQIVATLPVISPSQVSYDSDVFIDNYHYSTANAVKP